MKTVLNYPGSKQMIKNWILSYIPPHIVYVEPYFGSGTIFFDKEPAKIEIINDIDKDIYNYFKVLRDDPEKLIEKIMFTPFAIEEYKKSRELSIYDNEIERARKFAVRCYFGIGNSNVYKNGFRRSKSKTASNKSKTWAQLPDHLKKATIRLKNAIIENDEAINIIKKYNNKDVFIYCDPPYILSSRKNHLYNYEMTDNQHMELLKTLKDHKGKILISGYDNELYNEILEDWNKEVITASSECGKRIECLWMNYSIQMSLF